MQDIYKIFQLVYPEIFCVNNEDIAVLVHISSFLSD